MSELQRSTPARIGDYMIESQIGSGGMGMVYKAKQISMRRSVALKVLRENLANDAAYMERFFYEVRLMARMEHPNMVRVYEGGVDKKYAFFSMEYIKGEDLKIAVDRKRVFSGTEAAEIGRQVASALAYAWNKYQMVHRDVKPANIMLADDHTAKILDLGISKQYSGENVFVTSAGLMVGSPMYMSPEQARSESDLDCRADIYSLGVTLFHLLAGHPPYQGKTTVDVVTQHFSAPIPDVREERKDISKHFSKTIMKMMAKDKAERFESWEAVKSDLEAILAEIRETRRRQIRRQAQKTMRSMTPKLILVGVFFALVVTLLFLLPAAAPRGNRKTPPPVKRPDGTKLPAVKLPDVKLPDGAKPSAEDEQPIGREYVRERNALEKKVERQCDDLFHAGRYQDGIEYCRTFIPPDEFRPGGKFAERFAEDTRFQEFLNGKIEFFRKKMENDQKGLSE